MQKTVQELAERVQGKVTGDPQTLISGITNKENPAPGCVTFAQDEKTLRALEASEIGCVLVPAQIQNSSKPIIQVRDPKLAWAKLLEVFFPRAPFSGVLSETASIAKTARLGRGVTVGPFAVISDLAEVGDGAAILSHAYVGPRVHIGKNTVLHPGVVIYEDCRIGSNVTIHAGSVIGADGFGYVATAERQEKIPQVGNVVIEDDAELGACVTVDRATIGSTVICRGAKIDNQVQIAHNVTIGPHTVISAQSGVSGSSKVGAHVTLGGKAGLGDHVEIGDWTMVGAGSGFPSGKKVPAKQIVFGQPARPYQEARRQIAAQLRSAEMLDDIRKLRERVSELEKLIPKSPARD